MSASCESRLRPGVVLAQWCRLLFAGLIQGGVRHAVISPGSRSTPLVQQALKEEPLECHSVIDERSAGFFALGLAKATQAPVLLICTSGSALAHYLPAVIEARHSGVPLIILSADRPASLQDCGAAQTIEQTRIFGAFAANAPRLGEPSSEASSLRAVRRVGGQTVQLAKSGLRGPVHLNFPVAKPLEHATAEGTAEEEFVRGVEELLQGFPVVTPPPLPDHQSPQLCESVDELIVERATTVITVGPCTQAEVAAARDLAQALGCAIFGELDPERAPFSMARALSRWLGGAAGTPKRVIHVGPPCVAADWSRFVQGAEVELWLVPGPLWLDSESRASRVILGDILFRLQELVTLVLARVPGGNPPTSPAIDEALLARFASGALTEVHATAQLFSSLPRGTNLFLANSLSVRLAANLLGLAEGVGEVFVQRGANGIDGHIASAAGLAVGAQKPTLLVMGDVAAAHDLGSLALTRGLPVPLVIAVLDNQGGRIFDYLPACDALKDQPEAWRYWQTPPEVNWRAAATAFGLRFERCEKGSEVALAMSAAFERAETTLLQLVCDAEETQALLEELRSPTES